MSIVKLYIATTLDGYIAKPDGNIDWLTSLPYPDDGSDYGYSEFLSGIEITVMGRTTYEDILGMDMEWSYGGLKSYVMTSKADYEVQTPNTFAVGTDPEALVQELKSHAAKDIWLIGGGQVISAFLEKGLIDEMTITLVPKNLGEGIQLFPGKTPEIDWELTGVERFSTGLVNLTYKRK